MPLSFAPRYRPRALHHVASGLLYAAATGRLHDLYYEPGMAATLASWDAFDTIDTVLLSYLGLIDFQKAADQVRVFGRGPDQSPMARWLQRALVRIHDQQLSTLSRRPAYVRLKAVLEDLANEGLLVTDDSVVAMSRRTPCPREKINIPYIGLVTNDRPLHLRRSVLSYLENARAFDRHLHIIVIDRSTKTATRNDNRRMLVWAARKYGQHVSYADTPCLERCAERLIERGLPRAVAAQFIVGTDAGPTDASSLNAILLHTAGAYALIGDDTAICEAIPHPQRRESLLITQETAHEHIVVNDARSSAGSAPVDVLGLHEAVLDQSLAALLDQFSSSGVTLGRLCDHLLDAMTKPSSRVAVSTLGSLTRDPTSQRAGRFGSLYALDVAREWVLSHSPDAGGRTFSLDNRSLLPPFVGYGRTRDSVFRQLIAKLAPDAYFLDLPWALPCGALDGDTADDASASRTSSDELSFTVILSSCLSLAGLAVDTGDAAVRLTRTGRRLMTAAALPEQVLLEQIRPHLCRHADEDALSRPTFPAARELGPYGDARQLGAATQALIGQVGYLMHVWPDMVAASRALADAGEPIAEPV